MAVSATYYDGQSARMQDVRVSADNHAITFSGPDTLPNTWSIAGLHAIDPPAPGQPYRLTHDERPGARLVLQDEAFIAALLARNPQLKGGYSQRDIGHLLGWTFGGLAFFAALGYLALYVIPGPIAAALPQSWRERTGNEMEQAMSMGMARCTNSDGEKAIGHLIANLAEGTPDIPSISVRVYEIPIVNAFALNGGHIVVTKKLIETADKPEELAGVLAHEIGHVAHKHPETQMVRLAGMEVLTSLFSGTNGGNMTSNVAFLAVVLKQSREAESEADAYGREMLAKAQIDPEGMKTFFEKMLKIEKEQGSDSKALHVLGSILSTHPGTEERIKEIKPLPAGVTPKPALSDEDWKALKKICG
jgi:Zn-dependent protease with chaperone function